MRKMSRYLFVAVISLLIPVQSFARETVGAESKSVSKVGVLLAQGPSGQVSAVCEFPAAQEAPGFIPTELGESALASRRLPPCTSEQMKAVENISREASLGQTAGLAMVLPAAMCLAVAGATGYMMAKDFGLPATAGYVFGVSAFAVAQTLRLSLKALAGSALCALVGEGAASVYKFFVVYLAEPQY